MIIVLVEFGYVWYLNRGGAYIYEDFVEAYYFEWLLTFVKQL